MSQTIVHEPRTDQPTRSGTAVLFTITALLGASLLFVVQPLVAKMILPSFGGSATVWSTSSLFFQVLLLAGYLYTHWSTRRLGPHWQPRVHWIVLALPLVALPLALPAQAAPPVDASPTLWLLRVLTVMIGMPFLVLSTTGPLLQRWYAWTDAPRSDDPYFLFAASNLGSFGGLLAYPFLVEPHLTITQQRWSWSIGFILFALLVAACGLVATRGRAEAVVADGAPSVTPRPARRLVLTWAALAFLPSSLMLAVTAHLSTDVAAIPLLWVLPLAIYLATFVGAFARSSRKTPVAVTRLAVALAFATTVLVVSGVHLPVLISITVHLATLAAVGYAAHARLATTRPEPDHLTGFYVVVAIGGAIGGLLNGLVAPLVLNRVWEYGFTLGVVPLLLLGLLNAPGWLGRYHPVFTAVAMTALLAPVAVGLALLLVKVSGRSSVLTIVALASCIAVGWLVSRTPVPLAVVLTLAFLAVGMRAQAGSFATERTFFGSYQVLDRPGERVLAHGTTKHGVQLTDPAARDTPTTYYARTGPLGAVFDTWDARDIGVIGLGAGTMAAYGEPGQRMTFFEIDGEIAELAADPRVFSFIEDSPAEIDVQVGDGRLLVDRVPSKSYDLLVLDAFSSDAIPVHLLTREALAGFADRVRDGGALVVHISNRVFDLEPVLAAAEHDLGWHGAVGQGGSGVGSAVSRWVVLTRDTTAAERLQSRAAWRPLDQSRLVHWTDDYSSILSVLQ